MDLLKRTHRPIAILLVAALAAATLAPAAEASGKWRRYKGDRHRVTRVVRHVRYVPTSRVVYRDSHAGPVLAGVVGGLILGAAIAHASQPAVHVASYRYYDPYCDESYGTLDECALHFRHHDGVRVVQKIEVSTGRCVDRYRWSDGEWYSERGGDWDE